MKFKIETFKNFEKKVNKILFNLALPYDGKVFKIKEDTLEVYSKYTEKLGDTKLPLSHDINFIIKNKDWVLQIEYNNFFRELLQKLFKVNGMEIYFTSGMYLEVRQKTELGITYANIQYNLGTNFFGNQEKIIDIFKTSLKIIEGEYLGQLVKVYSPGTRYGYEDIYRYNGKYYKIGNLAHGPRYFLGINFKEVPNKTASELIEEAALDSIPDGYCLSK